MSQVASAVPAADAAEIPTPKDFFGFEMGAEGKLAAFLKGLDYMKLIAEKSDQMQYEPVGKTTMGNEYASFVVSSPDNLARPDQILEANGKLADPRNTTPEARALAEQTVPVLYIDATVHSTEVGNGQVMNDIIHRLATENSRPALIGDVERAEHVETPTGVAADSGERHRRHRGAHPRVLHVAGG